MQTKMPENGESSNRSNTVEAAPLAAAIRPASSPAAAGGGMLKTAAPASVPPAGLEDTIMKARQKIQDLMQGGSKGRATAAANLVKDQAVLFIDWRKNIRSLILSCASSIGLIAVMLVVMLAWGQIKIREGKDLISRLETISSQIDFKEKQMEEVFFFQDKLKIEKLLVERHIYWTDFFEFLESATLSNVRFSKFSGGVDGKYKLSASAPDFATIEKQVGVLKANPYVLRASVSGGKITYAMPNPALASSTALVAPKTSIAFMLDLEIDPKLFYDYQPAEKTQPGA